MTDKHTIIKQLRAVGVRRVVIYYSGSGDSGAVDTVYAFLTDESTRGENPVDVDQLINAAEDNPAGILIKVRDRLLGQPQTAMSKVLEQFAYDTLDNVGADDWCNNEGGQGTMTIYIERNPDKVDEAIDDPLTAAPPEGRIEIHHESNYTEVNRSSFVV